MRRSFPRLTRVLSAAVVFIGALAVPSAVLAQPAVLDQLPADTPLVVLVPSLSGLSGKITLLHDALGLDQPQMVNVLAEFKNVTGMTEGLNDAGTFALVMPDALAMVENEGGDPPMLVLVPVSDYAAFITNLNGDPSQAVATLTLPDGQTAFAKQTDGYAVLSPTQEDLDNFAPLEGEQSLRESIGQLGRGCVDRGDAAMIIKLDALAPVLMPILDIGMLQIEQEMAREMERDGAGGEIAALATKMVTAYGGAIKAVMNDTSTLVLGMDITEQGVGISKTAQFKPESRMAAIFAGGGDARPYLAKLAKGPYLASSAVNLQGVDVAAMLAPLEQIFSGDDLGSMGKLIQPLFGLIKPIKGFAMAYYQPQDMAMMGGGVFNAVSIVEVDDSQHYLASYKAYMEACDGVEIPIDPVNGTVMKINGKYSSDVLQIEGVSVDDYQLQYELPPQIMQEMGPAAPFMMMMGATGQSGYVAAKGDYVITTNSRDAKLLKQALAGLDQNAGMGTGDGIEKVRRTAGFGPSMYETYISVSGIVDGTVNMMMAMMGQQPFPVPNDLPPVATALGLANGGAIGRMFVPMEVLKFGKDTFDHATGMMGPQGGGEGQDGQGPPPAPF